jgi:hypothetical protein
MQLAAIKSSSLVRPINCLHQYTASSLANCSHASLYLSYSKTIAHYYIHWINSLQHHHCQILYRQAIDAGQSFHAFNVLKSLHWQRCLHAPHICDSGSYAAIKDQKKLRWIKSASTCPNTNTTPSFLHLQICLQIYYKPIFLTDQVINLDNAKASSSLKIELQVFIFRDK